MVVSLDVFARGANGEDMTNTTKNSLTQELEELFDLKKARIREEKLLTQEAHEAQKDIRLLTLMFRDGIPDVIIKTTDQESIKWDSRAQALLYQVNGHCQLLEGAPRKVMIRARPFLNDLVKKAKEFYSDEE
jgi:hypothetical protein